MIRAIRITLAAVAVVLALPLAAQAIRSEWAQNTSLRERVEAKALRRGDRGEAVTELQQLLQDAGYDPGPVDGIYGPRTESAVRAAQSTLNLGQDGLFGRLTLDAMTRPDAAETLPPARPVALVFHTSEGTAPDVLAPDQAQQRRPAGSAGRFALTFNGAPDPALLPRILQTLALHDMKATFFIQGEMAVARPELVAKIAEAGHEIGNAGFEAIDMSRLTGPMMQAQLRHAQKVIQAASGQTPTKFRPPLGRTGALLRKTTDDLKLETTLWTNVTVTDPEGADPSDLAARITETIYPGAVIRLHQDRESTVAALDKLLQAARAQGYLSTTLSDL